MTNKNNIIKIVKDQNESMVTVKNKLSSLPARIIIVGKSALSGKTNLVVNLLCNDNPEFFLHNFKGENIYLVSGSIGTDDKLNKLILFKQIPDENLMLSFNEEAITNVYDEVEIKFKDNVINKEKVNYLLILDDMSFKGDLKKKTFGILNKIFSNGRHINLSIIVTAQKYSDLPTSFRENMTNLFSFNCSNKQLDLISDDVNYLENSKLFKSKFRKATAVPHSFFICNFFKSIDKMYLNSDLEYI